MQGVNKNIDTDSCFCSDVSAFYASKPHIMFK